MRIFLIIVSIFFLAFPALAQESGPLSCRSGLSAKQIELIKESKSILSHVHPMAFEDTLDDIQQKDCPSIQVLMLAAVARTYADLIREYALEDTEAQERLYHKIQMNMAYLQFTAGKAKGDGSSLNRLIRQKLTYYLPEGVLAHPGFFVSVEGL